jgi:hypothetical protein
MLLRKTNRELWKHPLSALSRLSLPNVFRWLRFANDMIETSPQNRHLGYAPVSTYGQTLDAQLQQFRAEGCAKVSQRPTASNCAAAAIERQKIETEKAKQLATQKEEEARQLAAQKMEEAKRLAIQKAKEAKQIAALKKKEARQIATAKRNSNADRK